ncbi:MAG: S9 family peptidase, partial [Verrucomicrobiota bacterium]
MLVGEDDLRPSLEDDPLKVDSYQLSADRSKLLIYTNSKRVWRRKTRGDYWVYDISGRSLHQLGGPDAAPSSLMFAELSPDGENVCYVWENNLYVEDLRGGHIRALTSDGSETLINGTFDWVYEEELGLRKGFRWSPDSAHLAFWQLNTEGVRIFHLINNTDSLYPELIPIPYPKVGERNATARIGVLSIKENKPPVWIDMPGDPREHYLSHLNWIEGPDQLVIRQLNRLQNTARVFLADPASGEAESLFTDQDEAWVDTPPQIWIDHDTAFLWQSERDGWRHVYRVSRDGNEVQLVTPGDFDVTSIAGVDEKNDHLYFMASPDDATCRYLYRINLDGTGQVRVTPEGRTGVHRYQLDPTCRWAVHRFSNMATPPVADLIKIDGHETIEALSKNEKLKKEIAALAIAEPEFFQIEIEDGTRLDGWCLKPQNMDTGKKHPILFRVYGEPAGQTVMNQWSGKRHLWHLMLTQQGYVVISVDNRGTPAPRGRDWRKSVYRQVGILASADQAAATRALLKERPYLD